MRAAAIAAVAMLLFAACGDDDDAADDPVEHVEALIEIGVDCDGLFNVRDDIEPDDQRLPDLNEQLRDIGCFSRSSERTDDEQASETAPTTDVSFNVVDALEAAQQKYPELEAVDEDTAVEFIATACTMRNNGSTMDDVYERLAVVVAESELPRSVVPGLGFFLGAGMQALCPNYAPSR